MGCRGPALGAGPATRPQQQRPAVHQPDPRAGHRRPREHHLAERPSVPPRVGPRPAPISIRTRRSAEDRVFRSVARGAGFLTFVILVLVGVFLAIQAWPALQKMGLSLFTTTGFTTTGNHPKFGVEAALFGTVTIALIAMVVAIPISIGTALFISGSAPRTLLGFIPIKGFLTSVIDLMAAVPSVIYGLWGFFALAPHLASVAAWMSVHLSFIPIFSVPKGTVTFQGSAFIAGVLVGIMVMPILTSISREIFSLTPLSKRRGRGRPGGQPGPGHPRRGLPLGKGGLVGAIMLGLEKFVANAQEHGIQYPAARDPELKTEKAWAVHYYPTYAVIDRKGIIRTIGLQPQYVEAVVQKLLAEPAP